MDLLSILGLTPDSMQNKIIASQMQQPQAQPQPIADNTNDTDYLTQLQNSNAYVQPTQRVRARLPLPDTYQPTSGSQMEADSRSSIDDLMGKLAAQRDAYRQQDRNQQWMNFFGKLASSKSNTLLGGLGEAANTLAETSSKQQANNQSLDQSELQDRIKYEEWNREQARQEQALAQTGAYQQGELGLRRAALEQGHYTITPDGLGGFIKIDNKTGDTETIGNPMTGVSTNPVDDKGNPLTGDEYLKTLDPRIARTAKMVANGDMAWPSGFALKSPYWQNVIAAAQTYDPTANGNRFPAVKQFNTGKQGDQVRAFDVGISHLNTLSTLADGLDNNDTKLVNKAANLWKEQTGQEAPTDFNAAKEVVGNEIVKAIVGAGGGVGDREKAQQALNAANSPAQLKGVINTYKTLMSGQLGGLKQQYENSTGRKDFYDRLSPPSRSEMKPIAATGQSTPDATTAIQHAKDAIAAGAPRDAVIQRLKSMNISTDGL